MLAISLTSTMTTDIPLLSSGFRRLYCDATVFDSLSALHPISFRRALPFQSQDQVVDDRGLIDAEEALLADQNDATRRQVVEEYLKCGLLQETEASNLRGVLDFFDTEFFEMMGLVYANAGMFRCALRWYREQIRELETQSPNTRSDEESVYASIGYCLYSLGLFEEAISWSKSCIGPRPTADAICQALIAYEVEPYGGLIRGIERSGAAIRYSIISSQPTDAHQSVLRLKAAMKAVAPFQEVYIDWIVHETPTRSDIQPNGYPFKAEFGGGSLLRHKTNLIFAVCGRADALIDKGYILEAKRLLLEAALLESEAGIVWERLRALP